MLDRILDEPYEKQQLLGLFRPLYRDLLRQAFEEAARSLRLELSIDREQIERDALAAVRKMETSILATTRGEVQDIVNQALEENWTLDEIQSSLVQSKKFDATRAMLIARTETTRHSNRAAVDAFKAAEATGIKVEKMWLSARDERVRDAHKPGGGLDGQTVPVDGLFNWQGKTSEHPGGFEDAAMDINCRCTVVGKVVN